MKQKFINAVENKDVVSVRFFISNEMMLDPRGISCLEMVTYAEERMPNLYEKEDENTYSYNEEDLNIDYLNKIKNDLDFCFTKKLLMFYIEVAGIVLKEKANDLAQEEKRKHREQESTSKQNGYEYMRQDSEKINPFIEALEKFYHSKGFWPTVGAVGVAIAYFIVSQINNKK